MKISLTIAIAGLLLISCQSTSNKSKDRMDSTSSKETNEQPKAKSQEPKTSTALKVKDQVLLSYVACDSCGVRFLKDTKYGAITFYGMLKLKNTSGQTIREVMLDMPLRIKYKSGYINEFELCPGTNGSYHYITGLKGEWLKPENVKADIDIDYAHIEDWAPGATKTFQFYMGAPTNSVTGEKPYQRTPEALVLEPEVKKFMALDHEFWLEDLKPIDVKRFWIHKQQDLGYRD